MRLPLLSLAVVLCPLVASADTYSGTMCANFDPVACGCNLTCPGQLNILNYTEANRFDHTVPIYTAGTNVAPRGQLLVHFHGHGGDPESNVAFINYAAAVGYDALSLDYDYGRDYPPGSNSFPADSTCSNPFVNDNNQLVCGMSIDRVCGCFSSCYAERNSQIAFGGSNPGLPTTLTEWSVQYRLVQTIIWMTTHAHSQAERNRFATYLSNGQPNWPQIAVSAHSLGTSIAGYIGATKPVSRVILFSGICEKLFPDGAIGSSQWGNAFGCLNRNGTDEFGFAYPFTPGPACEATTYGFGGGGYCQLNMNAPTWVTGITNPNRFFVLQDTDDGTCNWTTTASKPGAVQIDNYAAHLAPSTNVGDYNNPVGVGSGHPHLLLSETSPGGHASQVCDGIQSNGKPIGGHTAVIDDNACVNEFGASLYRASEWDYMLTAPTTP